MGFYYTREDMLVIKRGIENCVVSVLNFFKKFKLC